MLILCMEASLITTVVSAPNQSNVCGVKLKYCSNRFIRPSSLVGLCIGYLPFVLFSFVLMVSIISFTVASGDFNFLGGLCLMVLILWIYKSYVITDLIWCKA